MLWLTLNSERLCSSETFLFSFFPRSSNCMEKQLKGLTKKPKRQQEAKAWKLMDTFVQKVERQTPQIPNANGSEKGLRGWLLTHRTATQYLAEYLYRRRCTCRLAWYFIPGAVAINSRRWSGQRLLTCSPLVLRTLESNSYSGTVFYIVEASCFWLSTALVYSGSKLYNISI